MVDVRAATIIPRHVAQPTVHDMQHPTASCAAQQPRQQRPTAACCLSRHQLFHVRVLREPLLVAREGVPRHVARVVIAQQDGPPLLRLAMSVGDLGSAVHETSAPLVSPEDVGAGIDRVGHQGVERAVDRQFPDDRAHFASSGQCGKCDLLLPEPQQQLPDAADLVEFLKHMRQRLADAGIGRELDCTGRSPDQTDREAELQLAARGFGLQGRLGTLAKQAELVFGHGPLHAK